MPSQIGLMEYTFANSPPLLKNFFFLIKHKPQQLL